MLAFFKRLALVIGLLASVVAMAADLQWRFPTDEITLERWTEFRTEVLAKPNTERQEFANQLVIISTSKRRIYVFTQPKHPAHPAIVVRAVVENGRGSDVQRMGHYAGSQKAFDAWWHEFDSLDAAIPGQTGRGK